VFIDVEHDEEEYGGFEFATKLEEFLLCSFMGENLTSKDT